jgi:hypothetical protein
MNCIIIFRIQFVIELFLHGISLLVVLSICVRRIKEICVIVNVDRCYSPQEACFVPKAGQSRRAGVFNGVR